MNLAVDPERFPRELGGWTGRVILCAMPSAAFATFEFSQPFELAAMVVGAALFVVGAAWFCSWEAMRATPARKRFVWSLKMAAWIKVALLLGAAIGWGLVALFHFEPVGYLMLGLLPDVFAGLGSLWLVAWLAGNPSLENLHGFGCVLAVTLVQGAVISGGLCLLAAALCGGHRPRASVGGRTSSPVRIWG